MLRISMLFQRIYKIEKRTGSKYSCYVIYNFNNHLSCIYLLLSLLFINIPYIINYI